MTFLNIPHTFFWYGVLDQMHGEGEDAAAVMDYAKKTIFTAATSAGREQCKAADWLLKKPTPAKADEFNRRAWAFAYWFVLSGRAATITEGVPGELGALEIGADGITVNRAKLPRKRTARQATPPRSTGGDYSPF